MLIHRRGKAQHKMGMVSDFMAGDKKSITLMGMSGVGKTYLSGVLEQSGWGRHSCDFDIAVSYLSEYLDVPVTSVDDMSPLSRFIGLVGAEDEGGLPLDEFKRRQKLYYDAECASMKAAIEKSKGASGNFVIDSTGSLCEILDEALIERLGRQTLFVYLQASKAAQEAVKERARSYPKPLFYPSAPFENWLNAYLDEIGANASSEIKPKEFARWVFPKLFESRLPKYEALANRYGVILASDDLHGVKTADDFMAVLNAHMQESAA